MQSNSQTPLKFAGYNKLKLFDYLESKIKVI